MNHLLDQIVLLGDSQTQIGYNNEMNGWCSSVHNAYIRRLDVINRGFSAIPPSPQHVPLEDYKANLKEMVNLIKSPSSNYHSTTTKIVLITPGALDDEVWNGGDDRGERTDEIMKLYADACVDVANEVNVSVVNIWQLIHDKLGKKKVVGGDDGDVFTLKDFLYDGLHFAGYGCDTLFDGLMKVIRENYPELDPDNIPIFLPAWDEMDPNKSLEDSLKFP
nr:6572_t:CDS:2 [Entrophospora candida]